jgi:zinc-binding alcohol dehydrogenase family protein
MKAVGFYRPLSIDAQDALVDIDLPTPELRPHDLLVRIEAISVNPADVKVRASAQPAEGQARILGYDAVGVIEAMGPVARLFQKGDAVYYAGTIDRPGTYAELHAVDERIVGHKPATLDAAQAAALPLTSLTAWELLFERLKVPYGPHFSNDAILIINGAGGVGSILTQMARRLTGLTVIATASRPESIAWCRGMGAHHVIDHRQPLEEGLKMIGIPEVRYVAGLTATDQHQKSIVSVLAPQGALALIDDPVTFDIVPFKRKSLSVHWELMFTRPLYTTADLAAQHRILDEVGALIDAGILRTTFREDYGPINATNLKRAHAALESGRSIGKIVLSGF